jgi:16S rRNA (cytosine1402-N4)-methyltransferase
MEFSHKPVLFKECIDGLAIKPDGIYVDGTLGGAGHAQGIANSLGPKGTLICIDRDDDAIKASGPRLASAKCRVEIVKGNYADIKEILSELGIDKIDGALLDLGVSSYQLDDPQRGFSYMSDAPLDMRMDREESGGAKDVVNGYSKEDLARIIREYGEEKFATRIASFIDEARKEKEIETTGELVSIIKNAIPAAARRDGPHPAKRTFQAIRIEVNDELGGLKRAVEDFCDVLGPGGRLCIISFHSLEDRIVKEIFNRRENPCTCPKNIPVCVCGKKPDVKKVNKKPILPSEGEEADNPRARSAKLRICEKL